MDQEARRDERLQGPDVPREQVQYPQCALAAVIWLFGWWSLWELAVYAQVGPLACALCLAGHVRFAAPLGQVPPLPDPIVLFIVASAFGFTVIFALGAALALFRIESEQDTWRWLTVASLLSTTLALRYDVAEDEVRNTFAEQGVDMADLKAFPSPPFVTRYHGYLSWFFSRLKGEEGATITIQKFSLPGGGNVEVWLPEGETAGPCTKKVFVYVHGGGWRGGHPRAHAHCHLLQALASRGWFVVSVGYRKKWPQHLSDTREALEWLQEDQAKGMGADVENVTMGGTSAGGHIISLLMVQIVRRSVDLGDLRTMPALPKGLVLFYPAADPMDMAEVTARLPFGLPCLRYESGQSLLRWYFQHLVMMDDDWEHAQPYKDLREMAPHRKEVWPPTLVVHGAQDSVVPLHHTHQLLALLASNETTPASLPKRQGDLLVVVPGGRHTFDLSANRASDMVNQGVAMWLEKVQASRRTAALPMVADVADVENPSAPAQPGNAQGERNGLAQQGHVARRILAAVDAISGGSSSEDTEED